MLNLEWSYIQNHNRNTHDLKTGWRLKPRADTLHATTENPIWTSFLQWLFGSFDDETPRHSGAHIRTPPTISWIPINCNISSLPSNKTPEPKQTVRKRRCLKIQEQ